MVLIHHGASNAQVMGTYNTLGKGAQRPPHVNWSNSHHIQNFKHNTKGLLWGEF